MRDPIIGAMVRPDEQIGGWYRSILSVRIAGVIRTGNPAARGPSAPLGSSETTSAARVEPSGAVVSKRASVLTLAKEVAARPFGFLSNAKVIVSPITSNYTRPGQRFP